MLKQAPFGAISFAFATAGLAGAAMLLREGFYGAAALFLLVGLGALRIVVRGLVHDFRERHEHRSVWHERLTQSDEDFISGCGVERDSREVPFALVVRAALAELAGVSAGTIRFDDSMCDSIWDSMDVLDVWLRVEKSAGVKIGKGWTEDALALAGDRSRLQVRHFVQGMSSNVIESAQADRKRSRLEHPA